MPTPNHSEQTFVGVHGLREVLDFDEFRCVPDFIFSALLTVGRWWARISLLVSATWAAAVAGAAAGTGRCRR